MEGKKIGILFGVHFWYKISKLFCMIRFFGIPVKNISGSMKVISKDQRL
jgi:hypothetical protein